MPDGDDGDVFAKAYIEALKGIVGKSVLGTAVADQDEAMFRDLWAEMGLETKGRLMDFLVTVDELEEQDGDDLCAVRLMVLRFLAKCTGCQIRMHLLADAEKYHGKGAKSE